MAISKGSDLLNRDKQHVWHPFSPVKGGYPLLPLKSSRGIYLITEDGQEIIDGIGSWWVNILGHSHPEIAQAMREQASEMAHVIFANFTHEPAVKLAEGIKKLLPGQDKVFFSDNGSTSVEVALKASMQYWRNTGNTERKKIIALEGAYHGDTFGAMAVGERNTFTHAFEPYLFDVEFIPFPEPDEEQKTLEVFKELVEKGDVAAFIFEPLVQGAAGMRKYSAKILDDLVGIAQAQEILCIADEVFTGFYRTGKPFASQYLENQPDIFCLSKGLTAGTMALGLTTFKDKIFAAFDSEDWDKALYHGHSFTGNPIACAVANKTLDILDRTETQNNIDRIVEWQKNAAASIASHPNADKVYQIGTILSLQVKNEAGSGYFNNLRNHIYEYFLKKNILMRPLGNVIYYLPSYITTENEAKYVHKEIINFLDTI